MSKRGAIQVFSDWQGIPGPQKMGVLHRDVVRGEEVLSFEYETDWLKHFNPFLLDPQLQHLRGRQFPDTSGSFGLFMDSAPDRWGRLLIQRRAALEQGRGVLFDTDYLLAVCDTGRLGGLRFKEEGGGPFLADTCERSIPPLHALRELEQAAQNFERSAPEDPEYKKWLGMLLAPGTSLGGARPKGSVIDPQGNLWVAKFPSHRDEFDTGAWEALVYELAEGAGIRTMPAGAERFSKNGHTFLIKRFDRQGSDRIHFASAMTLLGYHDGDGAETGASYLDLVGLIEQISESPDEDLEELWRRIVFNILVHNTDDHLRNHGFLLGARGWRLSPVYDVNPQPWPGGLALNIDETQNECSLELARSVAEYFRLTPDHAERIMDQVQKAVSNWELLAEKRRIPSGEVQGMRVAFEASLQ